ncbi:RluA family pseudouridine synthase [Paenibacillus woosongensis]|uniref:Pseudouridine synthase n=1 Tax=Paenibacillus woosongensis TaxID=307580 RepID=A0A7X2YY34_9BACL|nr:RluA family pseudouridine synthase [Paenibacillus woosongensis]MUG43908.1 RluA family pseudouridine synthase [Paenibacillus woosongensis]
MTQYYDPIVYVVTEDEDGWQLKKLLQRRLGVSRKLMSRLKLTEKGITLNGERVYISVPVKIGDIAAISLEKETSEDILPQPIPFECIYEDDALLIVNKSPGMIVHPTHGHYTDTLANGVVHYWREKGEMFRFRPVHRLDQETSGVLAIAKNAYVHQHISEQMIAGQVDKKYVAFVHGTPDPPEGTVDGPIDRDPEQPHLRIVISSGYPALTYYSTAQTMGPASKVELRLGTGRTHQIRVHMTSIGHPLIGDKMYQGPGSSGSQDQADSDEAKPGRMLDGLIQRQALHASELAFRHPLTGEFMSFHAPFPPDMASLEQALIAMI